MGEILSKESIERIRARLQGGDGVPVTTIELMCDSIETLRQLLIDAEQGVKDEQEVRKIVASVLEQTRERVEELRTALQGARDALHFTREYVGEDMLPAIPGWSWYDALGSIDGLLGTLAPQPDEKSSSDGALALRESSNMRREA